MASTSASLQIILPLIQELEKAYPNDHWILTASRIRKSYYRGFFWRVLMLRSLFLKVPNAQTGISAQTLKQLQQGQLIFQDTQDNSIDLRHACAVIESLASPRFHHVLRVITGLSIPAVISWSGDVGSVLTEYALTQGKYGDLKSYYRKFANPCDLFGDIDGYGLYSLGKGYRRAQLSDKLQEFYGQNLERRFDQFIQAAELTVTVQNDRRQLSLEAKQEVQRQISRFVFWVVLWKMMRRSPNKVGGIIQFFTHRPYAQRDVYQVSQWFIQWINEKL